MEFDNQILIQDGNKEKRVYISEYKEKKYLHLREFYDKDGEMMPGKGISFPVEKGEEILAAIKDVLASG